jgi:hypothetical protein
MEPGECWGPVSSEARKYAQHRCLGTDGVPAWVFGDGEEAPGSSQLRCLQIGRAAPCWVMTFIMLHDLQQQ